MRTLRLWTSLAVCVLVLLGSGARTADAAPWSLDDALAGLADRQPERRAETARALGGAWPDACLLATVLSEMAVADEHEGVRAAARESVHTLAGHGATYWAEVLRAEAALMVSPFHRTSAEWVEKFCVRTTDLARSLAAAKDDEEQVDVLHALPLIFAERFAGSEGAQGGLSLLLLDRALRGGQPARTAALAGLALWASAVLRDAGVAPPDALPAPPATWALLVSQMRSSWTWLQEISVCVLGATAPASDAIVRALATNLKEARETEEALEREQAPAAKQRPSLRPALCALRRMGPSSRIAVPDLRKLRDWGVAGAVEALVRAGESADLFPQSPETLVSTLEQQPGKALKDARALVDYLVAAAELSRVAPTLAQPAKRSLTLLATAPREAFDDPLGRQFLWAAALQTRASLGPLDDDERKRLQLRGVRPGHGQQLAIRVLHGRLGEETMDVLRDLRNAGPGERILAFGDESAALAAMRALARVAVHSGVLAESAWADEDVISPIALGLLDGLAETPDSARVWTDRLGRMLERAQELALPLHERTLHAAFQQDVHDKDPAPAPAIFRACEARRLAVLALRSAGPAAKAALPTLALFRNDLDVHLRWSALRAAAAIRGQ